MSKGEENNGGISTYLPALPLGSQPGGPPTHPRNHQERMEVKHAAKAFKRPRAAR